MATQSIQPKRYVYIGALLLLLLLGLWGLKRACGAASSFIPATITAVAYPEKMLPPAPETKYYCIDRFATYGEQKKQSNGDWELLRAYYTEKYEANYKLRWYQRGRNWHLDTSNWNFVSQGKDKKKDVNANANITWPKSPCRINKARKQISCSLVLVNGWLFRIRFTQYDGPDWEFVKILLHRIPVSEAAKNRQRLARLLGVKTINDIDICLRTGPSPMKTIFQTTDAKGR